MKTYRKSVLFLKLLCLCNKGSRYILRRNGVWFPSQSNLLQVPLRIVTIKTVFDADRKPPRIYASKEHSLVLGAYLGMAYATSWFLKKVFSDKAGEVFSSDTIVGSHPASSVFCQSKKCLYTSDGNLWSCRENMYWPVNTVHGCQCGYICAAAKVKLLRLTAQDACELLHLVPVGSRAPLQQFFSETIFVFIYVWFLNLKWYF